MTGVTSGPHLDALRAWVTTGALPFGSDADVRAHQVLQTADEQQARAEYTLADDALTVTLPGPQIGKRFHEALIPLAAIDGFFGEQPNQLARGAKQRAAGALALAARANGGKVVVAWRDGVRPRTRAAPLAAVPPASAGFSVCRA
jgi:hypothetical protein